MTQEGATKASTSNNTHVSIPQGASADASTMVTIEIPMKCPACGFGNFNIWGTKMNGMVNIVVKCMRCGK